MLLNSQWITKEIKREINYLKTNENVNTTYQNSWDAAKMVQKRKFIIKNAYIKKLESSEINNLNLHKGVDKAEQIKPKFSRRKEIRIRTEINEIEARKSKDQ